MIVSLKLIIHNSPFTFWAVKGNWTLDLFLTKEVLYHWATTAGIACLGFPLFSSFKELFRELNSLTIPLISRMLYRWTTTTGIANESISRSIQRTNSKSGRRGSNSPPIAWKAIALPNELLPLIVKELELFELWFWSFSIGKLYSDFKIPKLIGASSQVANGSRL